MLFFSVAVGNFSHVTLSRANREEAKKVCCGEESGGEVYCFWKLAVLTCAKTGSELTGKRKVFKSGKVWRLRQIENFTFWYEA